MKPLSWTQSIALGFVINLTWLVAVYLTIAPSLADRGF